MGNTRGRILCVDDDGDTRDMMTALLGLEGYEVLGAQSVAEGMSLALTGDFDLVLLDWVFKDGTGIELCTMIRNADPSTPILFYSGMALSADIDNAMRAGAQGFLVKPVDFDDLLHSVSTLVGA
jgi:DNA-binding response OmpR family regulator